MKPYLGEYKPFPLFLHILHIGSFMTELMKLVGSKIRYNSRVLSDLTLDS